MQRITFNKSRSRRGFDPIRIPDQTQKFRNEAARTVQGMKNVQTALERNARNHEEHRQASAQSASEIRASNKKFQDDWTKAYQEAELQPYKVAIDDAKLKAKEASLRHQDQKDLIGLLPKAAGLLSQAWVHRAEGIKDQMRAKMLRYKLSHEEIDIIRGNKDLIKDYHKKQETLKQRLKDANHSQKEIDDLFGLSGHKLTILQELSYIREGQNYGKRLQMMKTAVADGQATGCHTDEFGKANGGYKCLHNILSLTGEAKEQHLKAWIDEDFKEYTKQQFPNVKGVDGDDLLLRKHFTPLADKAYQELSSEFRLIKEGQAIQAEAKDIQEAMTVGLKSGEPVYKDLVHKHIDKNGKVTDPIALQNTRNTYALSVEAGLKNGDFTAQDKHTAANEELEVNGVTKKFKDHYPDINARWNRALKERQKTAEQHYEDKTIAQSMSASSELAQYAFQNNLVITPAQIERIGQRHFGDNPEGLRKWLEGPEATKFNLEIIHKDASIKWVEGRLTDPEGPGLGVATLLNSTFLNTEVIQEYKTKLPEYTANKDRIDKINGNWSKKLDFQLRGKAVDGKDLSTQATEMGIHATRTFNERLWQNAKDPTMTFDQAIREARQSVEEDITKGEGIFGISKVKIGTGKGYTYLQKRPDREFVDIIKAAQENPKDFLQSNHIKNLDEDVVKEIQKFHQRGEIHPLISGLDAVITQKSAAQISNEVLGTHGLKPEEARRHQRVYDYIDPEWRAIATDSRASYSQVNNAAKLTAKKNGSMNPVEELAQLWMDMTGDTDNPFDLIDGTVNSHQPGAESQTIGDLTTTQPLLKRSTFGAFALTTKDLQDATRAGMALPEDVFSKDTQMRIKEWLDDTATGEIQVEDNAGRRESILGVGQNHFSSHRGINSYKFSLPKPTYELGEAVNSDQNPFITYLQVIDQPIDTHRLQPFISGIIGKTKSTGDK